MGIVADLSTPAPAVFVSFDQDMVVMVLMVLAAFRRLPGLLLWPPRGEIPVSVAGTGSCVAVESHAGCRTDGPLVGARIRVVLGAGRHGTTLRTRANRIPRRRGGNARMAAVTAILSIQSSVAYGHVGNSAVTFPLMRIGIEVYPVITVHFSNHTGYGAWRGPHLAAGDL